MPDALAAAAPRSATVAVRQTTHGGSPSEVAVGERVKVSASGAVGRDIEDSRGGGEMDAIRHTGGEKDAHAEQVFWLWEAECHNVPS
ncbi:MAG: hypothetical protein H0W83_01190 [Planctomycetes bacterium]|nr:hypothetical protein [Planctomycetota bacterium]